jgi:hypothetical protein
MMSASAGSRARPVPYQVEPDQVSAQFEDGVLTITLPMPPNAVAKKQGRWIEAKRAVRDSATRAAQRKERMMASASQIKEHMEVKGSDGKHVGTVLGVENDRLKLASGGMDHEIDMAIVESVDHDTVRLRKTAEEVVRAWH